MFISTFKVMSQDTVFVDWIKIMKTKIELESGNPVVDFVQLTQTNLGRHASPYANSLECIPHTLRHG